jgi:MFS family permease
VVALGVVSLLTDVSSELLIYLVPLYLANVLGASPSIIGLIEGIAESVSAVLKLLSGALSDRLGRRRPLVIAGYSISVGAKAIYLVASTWPIVLLARIGDRIGKGIRTAPRDALIADSTPPDSRGRAFGLHRALDTAGAVIGVALAAIIIGSIQRDASLLTADAFTAVVIVALVPGALAVAVLVGFVREVRPGQAAAPAPAQWPVSPDQPTPGLGDRGIGGAIRALPTAFWLFVAAVGLFTLGNSSDAFIALRSQDLGVTVRDLLWLVVAFNVADAVIAWPMGALSDRVGRRGLIALAWGIYALVYLGFAAAGAAAAVPFLWILYGVYYGVIEAVGRALVADLVPSPMRATAYGIHAAAISIVILPASVIAGLLWDGIGAAAPFWFGAACALGAIGLLALARPADRAAGRGSEWSTAG